MNSVVSGTDGTSVEHGLYQDGNVEKESSSATPRTWDEMKEDLYQVFEELSNTNTKGVAISSPGVVSTEKGVVRGLSMIPYIHRSKIVDELEALFGLPVAIENNTDYTGLVESGFGVGQDSKNVLYLTIGSSIGDTVYQNGQLYKGNNLFGGEFGYMIIENGKTLSVLTNLVRVTGRYAKAHSLTDLPGKDLFDLADNGDEETKAVSADLYDILATGVFNCLINFNPNLIGIGDSISVRPDLVSELDKHIQGSVHDIEANGLTYELKIYQFRDDANLLGAVSSFLSTKRGNL